MLTDPLSARCRVRAVPRSGGARGGSSSLKRRPSAGRISRAALLAATSQQLCDAVSLRSRWCAGRFAVQAVVEHQEGKPEDPERMLGPQFVVLDVDVELLGEAVNRQCSQLPGGRIDVG